MIWSEAGKYFIKVRRGVRRARQLSSREGRLHVPAIVFLSHLLLFCHNKPRFKKLVSQYYSSSSSSVNRAVLRTER